MHTLITPKGVFAAVVTNEVNVVCRVVSWEKGAAFMSVAAWAGECFDDSLHEKGATVCRVKAGAEAK